MALPLAAVALVSVGLLASALMSSLIPFGAAVGLVLLTWAFFVPRVAAIVVVLSWLGPFAVAMLTRRVGGMAIGPGDAFLWVGLAGVCVRALVATPPTRFRVRPKFGWIVVAFFAVVLLAVGIGVRAGNRLGTASDAMLPCSAIFSYFLFREAYRGRPRTLAQDLFVLAGITSLGVVLSAGLGWSERLGTVVSDVYTRGVQDTALRIDSPAQRLALLGVLLFAVHGAPYRGWARRWRWVLALAMAGAIALSMTRSTWLPLILLLIVLPALVAPTGHVRHLVQRCAGATLVGVLALGLASSGLAGPWAQDAAARFASAADSNVTQDDSYQQRLVEDRAAIQQITDHPVSGIGFPRAYGVYVPYNEPTTKLTYYLPRYFIHNSYLGVWMWLGLAGVVTLVAFALLLLYVTWDVVLGPRTHDPRIPAAALGGIAVIAVISSFQTNLMYQPVYTVLAACMALIDLSYQARGRLAPSLWGLGTEPAVRYAWRTDEAGAQAASDSSLRRAGVTTRKR